MGPWGQGDRAADQTVVLCTGVSPSDKMVADCTV